MFWKPVRLYPLEEGCFRGTERLDLTEWVSSTHDMKSDEDYPAAGKHYVVSEEKVSEAMSRGDGIQIILYPEVEDLLSFRVAFQSCCTRS